MKNFTTDVNFFTRLDQAIRNSGMRATEIAAMAGIGEPYLSFLRRGKRKNPSAQLVQTLSEILACDLHWLLTGELNPRASYKLINGVAPPPDSALSVEQREALQRGQRGIIADIAGAPTAPSDQAVISIAVEGPAGACRRMTDPELLEHHSEFVTEIVVEKRELFRQAHAEVLRAIAVEFDARLRSAKAALLPKS